ncbi:amidase [Rhizobium sp. SG_E_25_P2]|uniref:amidase n=1 Tax=Rhizobium sp. SG_E_25_P2 TaxID=2879942 RepID=UPI002474B66A|nr:amidase [Rhizobium sp. SG_E_25_P2]MDH6268160.1 amidase [Rhizobium sp. SG_E_25_P2]
MAEDMLWAESFTALSERIRTGVLSPVQLTELMLDRIAAHDGALHAYVCVSADMALSSARQAEIEIRSGGWRGPLHGVPIAVKDVFYTTAIRTGLGSSIYDDWQPPYDSTATARLAAAGVVMLGKLTATEGVYADHHPSIAPPLNPFGANHWTGTSSSGSGVAVTAGLAYGTLGTDTGGSIRLPSACCGLVGIKPTWGRVSRHGVFPLAESLDHIGPMARSAADAAALLGAIAGVDPADPTAAPVPVPDYLASIGDGIADLAVGIDWRFIRSRATDEVCATIEHVLSTITRLGARIVDVEFPGTDDILRGWAVVCAVEAAIAHRETYPSRKAEFGPRLAALLERGNGFSGIELAEVLSGRREFTGRMAHLFSDVDLLVVPGLPVAGPTLDHMASLGEDPEAILAIGPFTAPFDICGYPTITVPCGTSTMGIPIGFQFVAKPFDEALLCRAAHAYQGVTDWHLRRPALSPHQEQRHA